MPSGKAHSFPGLDIRIESADAGGRPASIVRLRGEIGTQALDGFHRCLEDLLQGGETRFLLDFGEIRYMGSGGFGALLLLKSKTASRGGWLKICNLPPYLVKVMSAMGLERFFKCYAHAAEALEDPGDMPPPARP